MTRRDELEALHPTRLAVLCKNHADNCPDPTTAAKSRQLFNDWLPLQSAPSPNLREQRQKEANLRDLRNKMVEHLEGREEVEFYPKSRKTKN